MRPYDKPALSLTQQVSLLASRNMEISDRSEAEALLSRINYYRFTGYALEFRILDIAGNRLENFKPGTSFKAICARYEFDRSLRTLLMEALAPIEVAFRSRLALEMSLVCSNGFWYRDPALFRDLKIHNDFLKQVHVESEKSKEIFLQHYRQTYSPSNEPPIWMLTEILTMGTWSHLFKNLVQRKYRKQIASSFGTDPETLASWMHSLTYLRNLCAHHARLWNRRFAIRPKVSEELGAAVAQPDRLSIFLALLHLLHGNLNLEQTLPQKFAYLLNAYPALPLEPMGMQQDWLSKSFWTQQVRVP